MPRIKFTTIFSNNTLNHTRIKKELNRKETKLIEDEVTQEEIEYVKKQIILYQEEVEERKKLDMVNQGIIEEERRQLLLDANYRYHINKHGYITVICKCMNFSHESSHNDTCNAKYIIPSHNKLLIDMIVSKAVTSIRNICYKEIYVNDPDICPVCHSHSSVDDNMPSVDDNIISAMIQCLVK